MNVNRFGRNWCRKRKPRIEIMKKRRSIEFHMYRNNCDARQRHRDECTAAIDMYLCIRIHDVRVRAAPLVSRTHYYDYYDFIIVILGDACSINNVKTIRYFPQGTHSDTCTLCAQCSVCQGSSFAQFRWPKNVVDWLKENPSIQPDSNVLHIDSHITCIVQSIRTILAQNLRSRAIDT